MQYSDKDIKNLRKESLKLSDIPGKKGKLKAWILFLLGVLCVLYLISSGKEFIETRIELSQKNLNEIRVEILNGTEISGLAEQMAGELRRNGFDVIEYGNADKKLQKTIIIERRDRDLKNAKLVRRALRQGKISFEPHPLQLLEVTVVLGKDFKVQKKASVIQ